MVSGSDDTAVFQFVPDVVVELSAALIVWSHDKRPTGAVGVVSSDGVEAFVPVWNFMHAALALELRDGFTDAPVSEIVDDLLQPWILLSHDLIELGRAHPGILKLLEWPAGVHGLMLSGIANQDDPIVGTKPIEELTCLLCADETGFVDQVQLSTSRVRNRLGQVALQRLRGDPGFFELGCRARRRRQSLDFVSLSLRRDSDLAQGGGFA
jgi:hypothetical protein